MDRKNLKHKVFMEVAETISQLSHDKHSKFGCVIVDEDDHIVSTGFNGLPKGWDDEDDFFLERPEKYNWMCHSETNAIYNSSRNLKGCKVYVNGVPCLGCLIAMWNSGIKEIYYTGTMPKMIENEDYHRRLAVFKEKLEPQGLKMIKLDSHGRTEYFLRESQKECLLNHIKDIVRILNTNRLIETKQDYLRYFSNWALYTHGCIFSGLKLEYIQDSYMYKNTSHVLYVLKDENTSREYRFRVIINDGVWQIEDSTFEVVFDSRISKMVT